MGRVWCGVLLRSIGKGLQQRRVFEWGPGCRFVSINNLNSVETCRGLFASILLVLLFCLVLVKRIYFMKE